MRGRGEPLNRSRVFFSRGSGGLLSVDGSPAFTGTSDQLNKCMSALAYSPTPELIVTLNVDQVLEMEDSPAFRQIVHGAGLRTLDGAPLVALAKLLGVSEARRHTGADLLPMSAQASASGGPPVIILGGKEGIADIARGRLLQKFPGANVESIPFPVVSDLNDPRLQSVVNALRDFTPAIVFVCLGSPKQESWFDAWATQLPPAVYVGAGAAVDFAANVLSRAPRVIQVVGLEWLWRLFQEPRRLASRYLIRGPRFLGVIWRSLVGEKL